MAKKFTFRPEVVLKLRQQREETAQRRMAQCQGRVDELRSAVTGVHRRLAEQDALVRDGMLTGTVDVTYLSLYRRHVMTLHRSMVEHVQLLQGAHNELQQARGDLALAVKQRKVMSRLKEKLLHRYRVDLDRREQREMDEMSSMRRTNRGPFTPLAAAGPARLAGGGWE